MKIKPSDLYAGRDYLKEIGSRPMPAKIAIAMHLVLKAASGVLEQVELSRVQLVKEHGAVGEDKNIQVSQENMEAFTKAFMDLLNTEMDIDFEPLQVEQLKDLPIAPAEIATLSAFFVQ